MHFFKVFLILFAIVAAVIAIPAETKHKGLKKPLARTRRQYGFGGSNAFASATANAGSFGAPGGYGGFPGGYGGGFGGASAQATANAGAFGKR